MSSARAARRAVESGLGEDGFAGDVAGIVLLVSELVTNAVMHGQPPYAVVWELTDDMVRVSIEDGGTSRAPEIAATDPVDLKVGGNGLRFVEEFADTWGWDARNNGDGHPCGKTVWFTMDRSTR